MTSHSASEMAGALGMPEDVLHVYAMGQVQMYEMKGDDYKKLRMTEFKRERFP